jgi:hypothetical protein
MEGEEESLGQPRRGQERALESPREANRDQASRRERERGRGGIWQTIWQTIWQYIYIYIYTYIYIYIWRNMLQAKCITKHIAKTA